tara:strand:+ start:1102 stop:2466 length:1365 start_codon:yes stop_codon:yes gene_type:complete
MKILNKSGLYSFVALYAIICPLIILHTFGYFTTNYSSLYIETRPPGASIYLGNSLFKESSPTTLEELLPGYYFMQLKLKDHQLAYYRIWLAQAEDKALDKVLFLPDKPIAKKLSDRVFENLTTFFVDDLFIVNEGPNIRDYFFYNWRYDKLMPFISEGIVPWGSKVLSIFSVRGSEAILVKCDALGVKKYIFLKPLSDSVLVKDITDLVTGDPSRIEWDPKDLSQLFSFQDNFINRIDLNSGRNSPRYFEDAIGYGAYKRGVLVVKEIKTVKVYDFEKNKVIDLINDPLQGRFLFSEGGYFKVRPLFGNVILFLGLKKGSLSLNKAPYRFVEEGVKDFIFDYQLRRILLWQDDKVGIIDLGAERLGVSQTPKVIWVFKGANKIEQAFFVYQGSHIIIRDDNEVFLFELNYASLERLNPIVRVKEGSSILYSEETGLLYYLDPMTNKLISYPIIP